MNNTFSLNVKLVKHCLKNKRRITLSLIVSFLITGGITGTTVLARDLRPRQKEKNNVTPDNSGGGGPEMNTAANGADVVNIVDPNQDGISHNKFIDLSVGFGNALIFNNSMVHGISQLGGYVTKNTNLSKNATVILNEVTGNNISNINGGVEVFGPRADFILANENGISLNGATFLNTNGITMTTGKPTVNGGNIDFNVTKGEVDLNGVGTSGSYFNVLARTVKIQKEISSLKDEQNPDITVIAGENNIKLEKGKFADPKIIESKGTTSDKYGIYATELGAMYGKNIKLISTDKGLGVKHEGLIYSSNDIEINSEGEIVLANVSAKNNLKISGKKGLSTIPGTHKNTNEYNNSLIADKNIDINVVGDIIFNSSLQSADGNITIVAKNLTLKEKTKANIIGTKNVTIKLSEKLDIQAVVIPTIPNRDPNLPPLLIISNENGELLAKDPTTGKIYKSDEILWVSTGIFGEHIDILAKDILNKGIISANKNLILNTNNLINSENAIIKGNNIDITSLNGLTNYGEIRQNLKEKNEFVSSDGKLKFDITLGKMENFGNISGKELTILTQELVNNLSGKIIITDGNIIFTTTIGEFLNIGEILTNKKISIISQGNIKNLGKIGADNITIKGLNGEFFNAGNISAVNDLEIVVKT